MTVRHVGEDDVMAVVELDQPNVVRHLRLEVFHNGKVSFQTRANSMDMNRQDIIDAYEGLLQAEKEMAEHKTKFVED